MQKGYAAEPLAPVRFRPRSQIQCGIVRIRPKWGSPPTVKVDLFTYRERLRGSAEGSSTWISERHRTGRRNDSTKASCLDNQASLGALYNEVVYCKGGMMLRGPSERWSWFDSGHYHKTLERKGLPKAGESSLDSFGALFHFILYIHIIGVPEQSGTSGRLV